MPNITLHHENAFIHHRTCNKTPHTHQSGKNKLTIRAGEKVLEGIQNRALRETGWQCGGETFSTYAFGLPASRTRGKQSLWPRLSQTDEAARTAASWPEAMAPIFRAVTTQGRRALRVEAGAALGTWCPKDCSELRSMGSPGLPPSWRVSGLLGCLRLTCFCGREIFLCLFPLNCLQLKQIFMPKGPSWGWRILLSFKTRGTRQQSLSQASSVRKLPTQRPRQECLWQLFVQITKTGHNSIPIEGTSRNGHHM